MHGVVESQKTSAHCSLRSVGDDYEWKKNFTGHEKVELVMDDEVILDDTSKSTSRTSKLNSISRGICSREY